MVSSGDDFIHNGREIAAGSVVGNGDEAGQSLQHRLVNIDEGGGGGGNGFSLPPLTEINIVLGCLFRSQILLLLLCFSITKSQL